MLCYVTFWNKQQKLQQTPTAPTIPVLFSIHCKFYGYKVEEKTALTYSWVGFCYFNVKKKIFTKNVNNEFLFFSGFIEIVLVKWTQPKKNFLQNFSKLQKNKKF